MFSPYCVCRRECQQGPLLGLNVVAPQAIPVANVELAVSHDRIGPSFSSAELALNEGRLALFGTVGRRETTFLSVTLGRCFYQGNLARVVFGVDVKHAIRVAERSGPHVALLPLDLSCRKIHTHQSI